MTTDSDLGYLKDYGHIIISAFLILYGVLVSHLHHFYESHNE